MAENLELRGNMWYYRGVIGGKLKRVSTGYHDKERARRKAREIENEIRDGGNGWKRRAIPEFGPYTIEVLDGRYRNSVTVRTLMRRPIKLWSGKRLDELTHLMMLKYFEDRKADGAAPGTLEYERLALKTVFRMALDEGFKIGRNPLNGIRPFKANPKTRIITFDEETKMRAHCSEIWDLLLTVGIGTGMRASELRGVRPCDLVNDGGTWLRVPTWTNKRRKERMIPLCADIVDALDKARVLEFRDQRRDTTRRRLLDPSKTYKGAVPEPELPFFPFSSGASISDGIRRIGESAKLSESIAAHALRRTFATRCATTDPPMYPKHLQVIMGHDKIDTTMKYYVHLERASLIDSIGRMKLFNR